MIFPLGAAALLTFVTLGVVALLSLVAWMRRRPQAQLWRRALWLHAGLFVLHLFVTFPALVGYAASRWVATRSIDAVAADPANASKPAHSVHHVDSEDGVTLRLLRVAASGERPRAVVVLVHDLFGCAEHLEPVAASLRARGCECWLLELRNHGGSSRAPFTAGLREREDVLAAVRHVRTQPGTASRPLLLYGAGLGAVAVTLALPQIDGLAGVALDSPIDDLHAATHRTLRSPGAEDGGSWLRLDEPWRSLAITSLGLWSDFRVEDVAPARVLGNLPHDLPVLLIGRGGDARAPLETVERLFADLPMPAARRELQIRAPAELPHFDWLLAAK